MKELSDIKLIWKKASRRIEENNQLSRLIIEKAIQSKSLDVMAQFKREKLTGLISGAVVVPAIMIGILVSFPITWYSILLVSILGIAVTLAVLEGLKHLKTLKSYDESGNLQESLSQKVNYLKKNYQRGKIMAPVIGILFYIPVMLVYDYMEYGNLHLNQREIIALIVSSLLVIGISYGIIRFQEYKYIQPLKECLTELENLDPPVANTRPRINVGIILAILLIISFIMYAIATVF